MWILEWLWMHRAGMVQAASALAAIAAAGLWIWSAVVKLPEKIRAEVSGAAVGYAVIADFESKDLQDLAAGLRDQSRRSAWAAYCAAGAAILQAVAVPLTWT